MANSTEPKTEAKRLDQRAGPMEQAEDERALPGRWTICAMLFVATTINYMDRQVLSILKPVLSGSVLHLQPFFHGWPTVERSINMNEIQYGNIVWCFQIAYALGVIFAGRLVDRLGCRRGYPIVTAVWSLS
ncbi:MAG: MFS transporter, partial [Terracidiphilus sp.]